MTKWVLDNLVILLMAGLASFVITCYIASWLDRRKSPWKRK